MIYFVTVNYNGWQDTIKLIDSLFGNPYTNYKIVVVDNCSSDDSVKRITKHLEDLRNKGNKTSFVIIEEDEIHSDLANIPTVTIVKSKINGGFASGNNLAFDFLVKFKKKSELIWLINNDTIITESTINNLLNYTSTITAEKFAIATKSLIMNSNNKIDSEGWGYLNLLNGKVRHSKKYFGFTLKYLIGSSIVINEILYMDSRFFLYFEDVDYSLKIKESGFKQFYCQDSVIYHKCNATAKKVTIVKQFKLDSQIYFYKKRYSYLLPIILFQRLSFYLLFFKKTEIKYLLNSIKKILIYGR